MPLLMMETIFCFCDEYVLQKVIEDRGPDGVANRGLPGRNIEMSSITCAAWRHAARALSTLPGHYCIGREWWIILLVT